MKDLDQIARGAAREILGISRDLPLVQRKAKIQLIVLEALKQLTAYHRPEAK